MNLESLEKMYNEPSSKGAPRTPEKILSQRSKKRAIESNEQKPGDNSQFAVLLEQYLVAAKRTKGNEVLSDWLDENRKFFPFIGEEMDPVKIGGNRYDLMIAFKPGSTVPLRLPIDAIGLYLNSTDSPNRIKRFDPKNGEFILFQDRNPDYSFLNAQMVLQLLIANGVFLVRESWQVVFRYLDRVITEDFFAYFEALENFARKNLIGAYPSNLFIKDQRPLLLDTRK